MPHRRAEAVARRVGLLAYAALLASVVWWEAWAAPATPVSRFFWLGIKLVPLLVPLPALWRGSARAHVLAALLVLLYFCDGIALAYSSVKVGNPAALGYAVLEIAAAVTFVAAGSFYARFTLRRASAPTHAQKES